MARFAGTTLALALCAAGLAAAAAPRLTELDWNVRTGGQNLLALFTRSDCERCQHAHQTFDDLHEYVEENKVDTIQVFRIDCDATHTDKLCALANANEHTVPVVKRGNTFQLKPVFNLTMAHLVELVDNATLLCAPGRLAGCTPAQVAQIGEIEDMDPAELDTRIDELEQEVGQITATFREANTRLQEEFASLRAKHQADVDAQFVDSGLGSMRLVKEMRAKKKQPADDMRVPRQQAKVAMQ